MCQTIRIYLKVLQSFRKTILMKTIMRTFYHMLICWKANILIFCYLAPFWYDHKLTVRHLLKAISKCIIPCVKLPKYTYIFRYHCIFYLVGTGKHIFEYSKHDFTSAPGPSDRSCWLIYCFYTVLPALHHSTIL